MENKPTLASGYSPAAVQLVHSASLYIATKLGDLRDDLVVVGGLVPSLIVLQGQLAADRPLHVGTMDVDLGLAIAILDQQRYHELCERLRNAGFEPDTNEAGRPTSQRWRIESEGRAVTVDFLIPASLETDRGGALRNFEEGFSAIITPGLELAFEDKRLVTLAGETLRHEQASRELWVCEAGAFTVLKALAFDGRGENKDAYDLVYLLQNYGTGIRLTDDECRVIDTASFQRLRSLKQLGMGQVTYPGATHTRFAHSIGVLGIMARVTDVAREALNLSNEQVSDIRLAGLLHDVGHYPYSHLMEVIDNVILTEDFVGHGQKTLDASKDKYPGHEEVGELIVTQQNDMLVALGGQERAKRIADLFRRNETADPQLSKLIHSSLDMDRLDYLMRDAEAAGVPYGHIDLNYLINCLRVSKTGMIGVKPKAITALEHFALARFFMHKAVYYHKTTFGMEEATRQLLRRCKNAGRHGVPKSSEEIRTIAAGDRLGTFTDAFVDRIIQEAVADEDECIRSLAQSIQNRRIPKLLKEVVELGAEDPKGRLFKNESKHQLAALAESLGIDVGRFLYATTKPLSIEKRGGALDVKTARYLESEERDELVKAFVGDDEEPTSLVDIPETLLNHLGNQRWHSHRLYIVDNGDPNLVASAKEQVSKWAS